GADSIARSNGDADAGTYDHLMSVNVVGLAYSTDYPVRERSGVCRLRDRNLHNCEFVAPHSRDRISLSYHGAQAISHRSQELVTGGMTQRVGDVFEVIEVENMGSDDVAALGACQSVL